MDLTEYPILSSLALILGILSGLIGGWLMQKIAMQVDATKFNTGALFMLFQDIFILVSALVLYEASLIQILTLCFAMFIVPALSFLASKQYYKNQTG